MSGKIKFFLGFLAVIAGFLVTRIGLVFYNSTNTNTANIYQAINGAGNNNTSDSSKPKTSSENSLLKDTDSDGLPDREEIIYGTNPFKPDTDKDGFIDGEEIASGHDPLNSRNNSKAGPGKSSPGTLSANFTDRISDLAFASIVDDTGKIDPKSADQQNFANIVASSKREMAAYFYIPPLKDSDIKISSDNSIDNIKKYIGTIVPIVEEKTVSANSNIARSLSSDIGIGAGDYAGYRQAYDILLATEAPSSWKEIHKKTLTLLLGFSEAFKFMSGNIIEEDPIKATAALSQVQSLALEIPNLITTASNLMGSQNIKTNDIILNASKTN